MQLSDPTLMLAVAVVGIANGAVLSWGALLGASRRAALCWAAGSVLVALAAVSTFIITDPDSLWRAPLFNVPLLLGKACWLVGTLHFFARPVPQRPLVILVIVGIAITLWYSLVEPDHASRIVLTSAVVVVLRLATGLVLLRHGGQHNRGITLTAAVLMLLDAAVFTRHALTAWSSATGNAYGDPYMLTWISMLLSVAVAAPMFMLLAMARLLAELKRSANWDALTGILNRRGFFARSAPLLALGRRERRAGAVLMLDIDHFKSLNDRFGHATGDEVLRLMGQTLRGKLRGSDIAVRWGGEEFCVLMPGSDEVGALDCAERLRTDFSRRCRELAALDGAPVTVSVGIACGHWHEADFGTLQQRADTALYAAKHSGRDRVMTDSPQLHRIMEDEVAC